MGPSASDFAPQSAHPQTPSTTASTRVAAQLYTLRDFLKTPDDIARTLARVARIGYRAVQLAAVGPIEPRELRRICDDEGLVICASHVNFPMLRDELERVVEAHAIYDCRYVAIGSIPEDRRHGEGYRRFAREASEVARRMRDYGLTFCYHNHSFELEKYDGKTGLELLYAESDPEVFAAEIDTYWIQHGGGDPAWWIRRMTGRVPVVHLKDMTVRNNQPIMTEVGEGNLNWPAILDACRGAGVEWYVIEQDHCERDPFESLAISLGNVRNMGLG